MERSPLTLKLSTLSQLKVEREIWLDLHTRTERSDHLDGPLEREFRDSNRYMDQLLEQLFTLQAGPPAGEALYGD